MIAGGTKDARARSEKAVRTPEKYDRGVFQITYKVLPKTLPTKVLSALLQKKTTKSTAKLVYEVN